MKKLALFVCLLVVTVAAQAQFEKGKWILNPSITGLEFSHDTGTDKTSFGLEAKGGAFLLDNIALLVDGCNHCVYVDPAPELLSAMEAKRRADLEQEALLQGLKKKPNVTLDGTEIQVYANIGGVGDVGPGPFGSPPGWMEYWLYCPECPPRSRWRTTSPHSKDSSP